ncbi:MAG: hypothetical protein QMD99_20170 [Rhizobiaceae bacterium]|nr:hypothetical protein [Rhizobiaceae bacterium]
MAGYYVALQDERIETLESVVMQLVKGTWREEVKFCPRPPELANMVRDEQRRIDAMNRPRLPPPQAVPHHFRDIRITHRLKAEELAKNGYVLIASGVNHDQFYILTRGRSIPPGSTLLWGIDEVWCPKSVAHLANVGRIEEKSNEHGASSDEMSPERAAMMSRIMDLPDRKDITAEQQAYRRRVASELKASGEEEAVE